MTTSRNIAAQHRSNDAPGPARAFDGVICFGGVDWWYHNRGHYDLQMMREFSAEVPVLYINSIGMRVPRVGEGSMFLSRVKRKFKSLSRGLTRINDRFAVFSPAVLPGQRLGALTRKTLPLQASLAARRLGITKPLVWVACPPARVAALSMRRSGLIYQRTDRFEAFKGVNAEAIRADDVALKQHADLTLFCSGLLHQNESGECRHPLFVDHGVDFDAFSRAGAGAEFPADVANLKRPLIGFIGGIDSHTFDPALFLQVAKLLPDMHFALIGACSLPQGWCELPNVSLLGQRPYQQVPGYMAACDVLIMPWVNSDWIKACNPVKLKEYLAVGRPVVTTWFDEVRKYQDLVRIGADAQSFANAIREAIARPVSPEIGRARVCDQTWTAKARQVLAALRDSGIVQTTAPAQHAGAVSNESAHVVGGAR